MALCRSTFRCPTLGCRWRRLQTDQVKFASVQQLPLHVIPGAEADSSGQRQREADIKTWLLSSGANRLNFEWIGGLHNL
jgi:hypothetical protein